MSPAAQDTQALACHRNRDPRRCDAAIYKQRCNVCAAKQQGNVSHRAPVLPGFNLPWRMMHVLQAGVKYILGR